ncbi:DNA methyltransferase [Thermus aquaticus]|uniref:DNA methyltransferase n=1 Tax=Thermus aquaticus TaxID=271 RepID=UPI003D15F87E
MPPGNARAESAGARRGPFRRSPGPGRDGAGSRPGDLVLDSFAGSGTTLMAACRWWVGPSEWTGHWKR